MYITILNAHARYIFPTKAFSGNELFTKYEYELLESDPKFDEYMETDGEKQKY